MNKIPSHLNRLSEDKGACIAVFVLLIFILLAAFPSVFAPYDPNERFGPYVNPSVNHILGTDDMGNDIVSVLIFATRISLIVGICAGGLSMIIGITIGLVSGYGKGLVDDLLMGLTDIVLIIPKIPAIILIAALMRPGLWILILVLGLLSWETTARVVRARVMQVSAAPYILSARCLGFSKTYIMTREILPVTIPVIIPKFLLVVAGAMISEASLSFLGLSDPTMESWGKMIADAFSYGGFIRDMWWWYLPPALCICVSVYCMVRIGMIWERPGEEAAFE